MSGNVPEGRLPGHGQWTQGAAMRMTSVAVHPQSGAVSVVLLGLTGLVGFLAGAGVAVLAIDGDVATPPAAVRAATAPGFARQEVPADPVSSRDWPAPAAASAWP